MKVNHLRIFEPLSIDHEGPVTCSLCRFIDRTSPADARAAWGTERGDQFLDALARMDMADRAMYSKDTDAALLFDEPAGSGCYAKAWLEAFVNLLQVAPQEFLDGVPSSFLAKFLRAGAEVLDQSGLLTPDAGERGRAAAKALEQEAERA